MNRMVRYVAELFGRFRLRRQVDPRLPSLVRAMTELSSRSVVREVVASCNDRRQWGVLTAAWVGVSERDFARASARLLGLEFRERLPRLDSESYGSVIGESFSVYQAHGIVPIIEAGQVRELIAVDPAEARNVPHYDGTQPVSLGTWSEISRVLNELERAFRETAGRIEQEEAEQIADICRRILTLVVQEATNFGSDEVEIVSFAGGTKYQFTTAEGHRGSGAVHVDVARDFLAFLAQRTREPVEIAKQQVSVFAIGNEANFRLVWRTKAIELPAPAADEDAVENVAEENARHEVSEISSVSIPNEPTAHLASAPEQAQQGQQPLVMVVEDNPMFCNVLERLLIRNGYASSFESNGAAAWTKLDSANALLPAVIICDLHMPIMNGKEFLSKVRGDPRFRDLPILMLTSDDDVEAELALLGGGADAFVSKARDPRILCAHVRRLVEKRPQLRAA